MSEADRLAADAGPHGRRRPAGRHRSPRTPTSTAMAYDVVSNATLWFCHHHLFDLPRRPRFDRRWHEAWDAYRAFNRLLRRRRGAAQAPEGATVLVQDYHLSLIGPMLAGTGPTCGPSTSATPRSATRACCGSCPRPRPASCWPGWPGFGACGFHTARWEGAFRAAYDDAELAAAAGDRPAAGHLRGPARARPRGHHRPRPRAPACDRAGRGARRAGRRAPPDRPGRPGRAVEEHPARLAGPSRSCSRLGREWRGRGGAAGPRLPLAGGPGRVPRLPERGRAHRRADQRDLGDRPTGRPIILDVADDRDRSVAALQPLRRAAGEPGARRAQPGGQGGPPGQRDRRGARALPGGRCLGRAAGGGRRASTPSTSPARPHASNWR